jgi:hypothetical protein
MALTTHDPAQDASERQALRGRVKRLHEWLNRGDWEKCFSLVDPELRKGSRIELPAYTGSLRAFKEVYGAINPWYIRISLHLDASSSKRDPRPFAYVYVVWQDEAHGFHMFRERWVKQSGRWFTRVVGLVPNRQEPIGNQG